jgi:hypothetical protein
MSFSASDWEQAKLRGTDGALLERWLAPKWDDLRFPAAAVNPPGAESDPGRDLTDGTFLFDATATEVLFFGAQLPHGWVSGTELRAHVHWCKTTSASGAVVWKWRYRLAAPGKVLSAWSDLATAELVISDGNTAEQHALSAFPAITVHATPSAMLLIELERIGGDSGDTYGADAKLMEFDIHVQCDALGTVNEYSN